MTQTHTGNKTRTKKRYDTEGNGEMPLGELSHAMAEIVGLTKEEVMPMFLQQAPRSEEVCAVL